MRIKNNKNNCSTKQDPILPPDIVVFRILLYSDSGVWLIINHGSTHSPLHRRLFIYSTGHGWIENNRGFFPIF